MSPVFAAILGSVAGFLVALVPEAYMLFRAWWLTKHPAPATNTPTAQDASYVLPDGGQGAAEATDGTTLPATPAPAPAPAPTTDCDSLEYVAPATQADFPITYVCMDVLRTSVRPVLTYAFFILFAAMRIVAMHHAYVVDHAKSIDILPILWDEGTEALFATVLGFWFGTRAISRARRGI